jgi:hypothetical protein
MLKLSWIQQMSVRERRLTILVLFVLGLVAVVVLHLRTMGQIEDLELEMMDGKEAVLLIHARSQEYRDSMRRKAALEEAIKANDQRIQTAIDSMAKKVELSGSPDGQAASGTLNTILRYDAKTTERPIFLGSTDKKQRSSQKRTTEFFELSQPFEYSFVGFSDLIKFLDDVEAPKRLMYVSKMQVTRKYMEPDYIQGRVTVSTFIYKPQISKEKEEE